MDLEEDYSPPRQAPGTLKSLLMAGGLIAVVIGSIFYLGGADDSDVVVNKIVPSAEAQAAREVNPATEPGIEWPVVR